MNSSHHPGLTIAVIEATLSEILLPEKRPFCAEYEIAEIPDIQFIEQLLMTMSRCGFSPEGQPLSLALNAFDEHQNQTQGVPEEGLIKRFLKLLPHPFSADEPKNATPNPTPLIGSDVWLIHGEHLVHPEIRIEDSFAQEAKSGPDTPSVQTNTLTVIAGLLQTCLFTHHINGVFQASVQSKILTLLSTEKKSSKRLKEELVEFFELNYTQIVKMTHSFIKAAACSALSTSNGPQSTEPFLLVDLKNIRQSHFSYIEDTYQESFVLASQLSGKDLGLFDRKDLLALSLAPPKDAFIALVHGIQLFHTLAKQFMEPSSRIARIEFALEREGIAAQRSVAWEFFKSALNP